MTQDPGAVNGETLSEERFAEIDLATFLALVSAGTEMVTETEDILRGAETGITAKDWDVLAFISTMGPSRPSQVLRRVALTSRPQTLSSILGRLEKRGLVTRTIHPDDSRGVLVEATTEGTAMVDAVFPLIARRIVGPFASHYTDDELKTLATLLNRVSDRGRLAL